MMHKAQARLELDPHADAGGSAQIPLLTVTTEPKAAAKTPATEVRASVQIYQGISNPSWWSSGFGEAEAQDAISQIKDDVNVIELRIHSRGGSAFIGFFVANLFRRHAKKIGARIETVCDGLALSIASYLFSLGEKRTIAANGLLMIHTAWSEVSGDADDLEAAATFLRTKIDPKILDRYASISTLSEEDLVTAMRAPGANGAKGTWYSAEEAVELGFATHIEDLDTPDVPDGERAAIARVKGAPPQALALYGPKAEGESEEDALARECLEMAAHEEFHDVSAGSAEELALIAECLQGE